MSDLEPIAGFLPAFTGRRRRDPLAVAARIAWPQVVGDQVARHSAPIRVSGDALVVDCSSSTWPSELTLLASHIRERLEEVLTEPLPDRLRFEVGEIPQAAAERADPVRPPIDPARAERARELAAGVADEGLRHALEHAIGGSAGTVS